MKRRQLTGGERADWLRLSRTRGVGPITFFHLLERYGSAAAALEDLPSLARKASGKAEIKAPDLSDIKREIDATAKLGAAHLAACEPDYSICLAAIDAPPPVIAIRGNRTLLHQQSIAIVGARDASAAGRRMARDLARDLGQAGYIIVSGMARGIDGEAHAAAMDTGTVAAIAGGIDQVYPPQHEQLYGVLAQRGCLVSESPFGYVAQARDFPKRNRVISGLSLVTIIVEAAERSGSLITARFALEQGREVMAVPGSPLDPRARGTNRLLKQGAALIESAEDVLHAMEGISPPSCRRRRVPGQGQDHQQVPGPRTTQVLASYGHVRDLPAKDGSVARRGLRHVWEVDAKSQKHLKRHRRRREGRRPRPDPRDRPGSRRRGHLLARPRGAAAEEGAQGQDVERVTFNAITKKAVLEAMEEPARDRPGAGRRLPRAPRARLSRRLHLSPVLWRKLPGSRSAGRVQSVALRLICERESRSSLRPQEYWTVEAPTSAPPTAAGSRPA
jgi:DNA processing protein